MPFQGQPRTSAAGRLAGDTGGATAVEFGLVALPFFALLGATIQVAFMIWAQQNFDFVFRQAARDLFTGRFQTSNSQTATDATLLTALQTSMCGAGTATRVVAFNCSAVKIDISLGTNFASSTPVYPVNTATRDWNTGFGTSYVCPAPGTIVIATAAVKFPVFFGLFDAGLADFADGNALLMATTVFRAEPYATAGNSPC